VRVDQTGALLKYRVSGVSDGFTCSISATTPLTVAAACEVPDMVISLAGSVIHEGNSFAKVPLLGA
jgi:hypothetical protein